MLMSDHLMMEDKVVLISGYQNIVAQFKLLVLFPFANPLSMLFKDRKEFFFVGNNLSFDQPSFDQIDVLVKQLMVLIQTYQ